MSSLALPFPGRATHAPLVVAYGMGVDSTAMLVELVRRQIRPDLILFADTGGESPATYAYRQVIDGFLARAGYPAITTVRYRPRHGKYDTLEGNCLVNRTLPSLAFGRRSCSQKWKREPQDAYVARFEPARAAWDAGLLVRKAIGYDAGPKDARRATIPRDRRDEYWYPLRDWAWDRARCAAEIARAGLPVPPKSACFFCPATKPAELLALVRAHPAYAGRIRAIEAAAAPGLHTIEGLWRRATRARPGSMTAFLDAPGSYPC